MKIDAHQHFWKLSRGDYEWLTPKYKDIYRDHLPEELSPILSKNGIDKTILVQAAATIEETKYMLELYNQYDFIIGVVGWLDFESPNFEEQLDYFVEQKGFLGVRPMIQDIEDETWMLRDTVLKNIGLIVEKDLAFDFLVHPNHLKYVQGLLKVYPTIRGVIDHLAKPKIRDKQWDGWAEDMKNISENQNIYCKVSGLITEANHKNWSIDEFKPYIQFILDIFGVSRVMFGSDWPVCNQSGSYEDTIKVLKGNMTETQWNSLYEKLFGLNAYTFYNIQNRG